jgi:predicted AAA+ superfamily ATPase
MIERSAHLSSLRGLLRGNRVVAILGPRQVGKTTLARSLFDTTKGKKRFFDLENPRDLAVLDDPLLALESQHGLVVLCATRARCAAGALDRARGEMMHELRWV